MIFEFDTSDKDMSLPLITEPLSMVDEAIVLKETSLLRTVELFIVDVATVLREILLLSKVELFIVDVEMLLKVLVE